MRKCAASIFKMKFSFFYKVPDKNLKLEYIPWSWRAWFAIIALPLIISAIWANYLISVGLNCITCKVGIIIVFTSVLCSGFYEPVNINCLAQCLTSNKPLCQKQKLERVVVHIFFFFFQNIKPLIICNNIGFAKMKFFQLLI